MGGVVKKVAKVATLGLSVTKLGRKALGIGTAGLIGEVPGGVSPLDGITGKAARDAAQQAAEQQAAIAKQQAVIQQNANAIAANTVSDNVATVVAGGTAGASGEDGMDFRRRQRASLSSTLGV